MVNAWSLLYEELNGTMDEVYPVMTDNTITPQESDEYDPIVTTVGSGNTATYTVSDGADYFMMSGTIKFFEEQNFHLHYEFFPYRR